MKIFLFFVPKYTMDFLEGSFSYIYQDAKKDLVEVEDFYSNLIKDFDETSFKKELKHVDFEENLKNGIMSYGLDEGFLITALHVPYDTQRVEIEIGTVFKPFVIKMIWSASSNKSIERILEESKTLPNECGVEDFIRIVPYKPFIYVGNQKIRIRLEGFSGKYEYYLELCKYLGKLIKHTFPFNGDAKYYNGKYREVRKSLFSFPEDIERIDKRSMYIVDLLDGKDPWDLDFFE